MGGGSVNKGMIFTLISLFLFTSIMLASISVNIRLIDEKRVLSQRIPSRIVRDTYQSVSLDLSRIHKTRIINNTIIDELLTTQLSNYQQLLNQLPYDVNVTMNDYLINCNNKTIVYGNNKSWINATNTSLIGINISSTITTVNYDWVWVNSGKWVKLMIYYLNNSQVINGSISGYINESRDNWVLINTTNGSVKLIVNNYVFINTTTPINTTLGYFNNCYTSDIIRINSRVINLTKEFNATLR